MHLTDCGNCSAFKIARDVALKGRQDMPRRLARDSAPEAKSSAAAVVDRFDDETCRLLLKTMVTDFPAEFKKLLRELGGEEPDAEDDNLLDREMGPMDDPANPRSPAMDRRLAHDSASSKSRARFAELHPEAERITAAGVGYGVKADFGRAPAASKSFADMHPDAMRIRN